MPRGDGNREARTSHRRDMDQGVQSRNEDPRAPPRQGSCLPRRDRRRRAVGPRRSDLRRPRRRVGHRDVGGTTLRSLRRVRMHRGGGGGGRHGRRAERAAGRAVERHRGRIRQQEGQEGAAGPRARGGDEGREAGLRFDVRGGGGIFDEREFPGGECFDRRRLDETTDDFIVVRRLSLGISPQSSPRDTLFLSSRFFFVE